MQAEIYIYSLQTDLEYSNAINRNEFGLDLHAAVVHAMFIRVPNLYDTRHWRGVVSN